MDPDTRAKVESLCLEALSKDARERAAFLDEACGADPDLRREVESLLAGRAEADALLHTRSSVATAPPLPPGTRLGPYEIQSFIGAGGMGQVYKAHDTRLGRAVAVKVLPSDLAAHPERRRRFEQEARAASALNDPHICTLHDIGSDSLAVAGGGATLDYLVMEYLEGQTLAARLRKGPLPLDQALEYATQIADALSKAHRLGIVHRDLKPGNVMLTKSGAKLLDFGLAKLKPAALAAAVAASALPTIEPETSPGMLLGTVPYMAPEQLEGKEADAQSDLFSFGAVLYEMLAGKRAFEGESHASVVAAILEHEPPPLSSLQPVTPPALEHLVRRCLAKDPEQRWQSAADVAEDLRWLRESSASAPLPSAERRHRRVVRMAGIVAAVAGAAAAGGALVWSTRPMPRAAIARSELNVKPAESLNAGGTRTARLMTPGGSRTAFTWTPDGQTLVFVGRQGADKEPFKALNAQRLYVRPLDATEARPLKGTEGAHAPAVSPDGQWVAFWAAGANGAEGAIRKVPLRGGPVQELFKTDDAPFGLVFDDRGTLFFGNRSSGIWQIPAEGQPSPVTKPEYPMTDILPGPLPGGRVVLYTKRYRALSWGDETVVAQTLATGKVKPLLENAADARYVPTGHLVFMRQGRLFAVRFDPERIEKLGEEVPVVDDVVQALTGSLNADVTGAGQFALASTGTLAYLEGVVVAPDPRRAVVMLDRAGNETPLPCRPSSYGPAVRFSSAGGRRRLAVVIDGLTERSLWLCDLDRDGLLTPLVKEGEVLNAPLWFPDGRQMAFQWFMAGKPWIATIPSDTGLTTSPRKRVEGVSHLHSFAEGEREVAAVVPGSGAAIINVEDGNRRDLPPEGLQQPQLSPDRRWLAYMMPVTDGRSEIHVRPYPGPGQSLPVSTEGGISPAWNPNGRELFFGVDRGAGENWLMAADFEPGPPPRVGRPHKLFQVYRGDMALFGPAVRLYDVAPDGQHFFVVKREPPSPLPVVTHVNLIMNWFEELRAKAPRR